MSITARTVAYLLTKEGLVPEAYLDDGGIWTFAGGIAATSGLDVIQYKDNPQPLEFCLRETVNLITTRFFPSVIKAFGGRNLTENEMAGALSFHWRNGSILTAQWVKDWLEGKPSTAAADFMQWTNHGKQIDRATSDRDLFFNGLWPASLLVSVYRVDKPSYKPGGSTLTDVMPALLEILGL